MDTVTILRRLWRLRLFVVLVGVLALLAAYVFGFKPGTLQSRKYSVGIASSRIFVDTPASQVVDVSPKGSDTTGARANLLANLMVDGEIKTAIAKRAGINPNALYGTSTTAVNPPAAVAPPAKNAYELTTDVTALPNGGWLPVIDVQTQGPDRAAAQKLANAAILGLEDYLNSKAAADAVKNADRLRVTGLGVAQSQDVVRGPRNAFVLGLALALFIAGCAAILGISGIVRGLREPEDGPDLDAPVEFGDDPFEPGPSSWPRRTRQLPPAPAAIEWDASEAEPAAEPDTAADAVDSAAKSPTSSATGWWAGGPS